MSCNSCSKKFNIFSFEHGCPSCGFSYCSKCLKYTIFVKKLNKVDKVCSRCKNRENLTYNSIEVISAPQNSRNVAPKETLAMPSVLPSSSKENNQADNLDPDKQIIERLKKLKERKEDNNISAVTDQELNRRLTLLKDKDPNKIIKSNQTINTVDLRSEEEKVNDLMTQIMEECKIDESHNSIDDQLRTRINNLRGVPITKEQQLDAIKEFDDKEEENEEKQILNIIQRYKAEVELDSDGSESDMKEDLKELPWCVICNTDAVLRCLDCDNDLFCDSCYKQSHSEWNYNDHTTNKYKSN